jgi:hypothetical protein
MKRISLIFLVIFAALITSIITFIVIEKSKILQVNKYSMDVKVTNDSIIGINADPGFHFGSLRRGEGSAKKIIITGVEEDMLVVIAKRGEIAKWVSVPDKFILKKGEDKNISIAVGIPQNAPLGNYTGELIVMMRKPQ